MTSHTEMMRDWFERIWNQCDTTALDEYLAPDGVIEGIDADPVKGPANFKAFHAGLCAAIDNLHVEVIDMIECEEKVCGHFVVTGVHRSTGKPVRFTSHFFGKVKDGKVVHAANDVDYLGMLIQIGAVSPDIMAKAMATPAS